MLYSFDVFDTCLCRLCGEPRLLFDVLSLKVREGIGMSCNEQLRQLFVATRAEAIGSDLQEIYKKVALSFPLPYSVERMAEMELEMEKQMLVPIVATLKLVHRLRKKGDICFISDMYLPSSFIKERLVEFGFFKEGDKLYVSDELRAWKYDGSLFRHVRKSLEVPYRKWHHYGNCRHSDYRVPRRLGIHAHHLFYGYLPCEERWRQIPVLQYQYPAILAGAARAVRLSTEVTEDQKAFVCDISGPLMVTWVLRVMGDALRNGVKRLYFCARDMHTQFLVAQRLQPLFPGLTVHYLFISRAAIQAEDDESAFKFFLQIKLASDEKTAIVDSNSRGITLRVLNRKMKEHGCSPISGYFLFSEAFPKTPALSIPSITSRYIGMLGNKKGRSLMGMNIFFELILSLNYHQRTAGYTRCGNVVKPFFGQDDDDRWVVQGIGTRQAKKGNDLLALRCCDAMVNTGLYQYADQLYEHVVIPSLTDFFYCPHKTYLRYLRRFVWWGRPFVGLRFGRHKGLWHRGSLMYCLPNFLSGWIWKNRK